MSERAPASVSLGERLGRLDRRWLYLGLFLVTLLPVLIGVGLPIYVTPAVQDLYDAIEKLPPDKLVFVSSNWDAGTQPENRPQTKAIFRHLLRRQLKFVILSVGSPNAPQLTQTVLDEAIALEREAGGPATSYGVDYVNTGFKIRNQP